MIYSVHVLEEQNAYCIGELGVGNVLTISVVLLYLVLAVKEKKISFELVHLCWYLYMLQETPRTTPRCHLDIMLQKTIYIFKNYRF